MFLPRSRLSPGLLAVAALGLACVSARAGVVEPLVTDAKLHGVFGITNDGGSLYATTVTDSVNSTIASTPIGGGPVSTLYTGWGVSGFRVPSGITPLGSDLYWIDHESGTGTGTEILKAPKGGGGPITTVYNLGAPIVDGSGIVTDGSKLYTADYVQGRVTSLNLDGTDISQLGSRYGGFFDVEHLNTLAINGNTLYIADSGEHGNSGTSMVPPQILSISTSGGPFTPLFVGAPFMDLTGIAVGNDTIFVSDRGANTVWGLSLSGGDPFVVAADPRFKSLGGLTYSNGALYVADNGDPTTGTIWKVNVVPEPGSMILLGVGAAAIFGYRWRQRRLADR